MLTLKKSLGQHFLTDETVSRRIVEVLTARPVTNLLEVGPGGGALTKHLVQLPGVTLKCIEIDIEKVEFLKKTFPALAGNILHADVLASPPPFDGLFTVVGNFPYNISTEIVFRMLDWKERIESMTGMFQKEVAERLSAKEGSRIYGVTSVLVQAYFSVDYLFEVDEKAFDPPPKIKSAVIRMTPLASPVDMVNPHSFRVLVKTAFNQRRKTLRNAVRALFTPDVLRMDMFGKRAEQLSVEEFGRLSYLMQQYNDSTWTDKQTLL